MENRKKQPWKTGAGRRTEWKTSAERAREHK